MTTKWRFDQGRGKYHAFENIVEIAKALIALEGVNPSARPCPIRSYFKSKSVDLDFASGDDDSAYPAWRNYARTFSLLMLVPGGGVGRIEPTDICREISKGHSGKIATFDDYLNLLFGRWTYPHPAFDGYSSLIPPCFPLLAILKMLTARLQLTGSGNLSTREVFEFLINNEVSGLEPMSVYKSLSKDPAPFTGGEERQLRELLRFISQSTYFNWSESLIHLTLSERDALGLINQIEVYESPPKADRWEQLVDLAALSSSTVKIFSPTAMTSFLSEETEFIEGRKIRAFHVRTERDPRLRSDFLKTLPRPFTCDFCVKTMRDVYPWSHDFIEVHHLLPLASAIRIGKQSTSLVDLVPLCPNCHRAVHYAYSKYLKNSKKEDFENPDDAKSCYESAKKEYICTLS